ncbi:MFS transporter [Microbacterium sp. JB110]|uniref:MFS transporter n=1 Tax=Microbacterium sp. JB110 TaxID=2024477 RepID=UPI00097F546D|nr:MFS transporter [Microbacterium sp. JB110]RCS60825.1 MFS transporter [Microbacterium sp. JB110]SJM64520.1 Tetracycline resistance protein [Frigoribacterium sp. JB110]
MTVQATPPVALARTRIGVLIASNLLGGVGVASSIAVAGLMAERLAGTEFAGLGQAMSVLGAAVAAIPLATLAAKAGRRAALSVGYLIALLGAVTIITAAVVEQFILLLIGLAMFGTAQAVNLQSRYAAGENASAAARGRVMSLVIWSTTIGSVAGPNLTNLGNEFGFSLGLPELAGPYVFSAIAIACAATVIVVFYGGDRTRRPSDVIAAPNGRGDATDSVRAEAPGLAADVARVSAMAALRWAFAHPRARMAVVLTACAHSVMVMVMVMTPVHMQHHGDSLTIVGVVISLHVLGMYALSPLFGWFVDRIGAVRTAAIGVALLLAAVVLGLIAASLGGGWTPTALVVLGIGWSACIISSSTVLASNPDASVKLPLQGVTDAGMNYAGAAAAALAGPILAWGGFHGVNIVALVLLAPAAVLVVVQLVRAER